MEKMQYFQSTYVKKKTLSNTLAIFKVAYTVRLSDQKMKTKVECNKVK